MFFGNKKIAATTLETLTVFLIAITVRLIHLDHDPIYDELYHILAAQSWIKDGSLSIGDGEYTRSFFFTIFLGWIFSIFGNDLIVARMVSVIAGSWWIAGMFVWMRGSESRAAAWVSALLLATSAHAIFLSQYIRFYALHGLLFFIIAVSWFYVATQYEKLSTVKFASIFLPITLLFTIALHLQITTLIGMAGLITWTVIYFYKEIYVFIINRIQSGDKRFVARVITGVSLTTALVIIGWGFIIVVVDKYRFSALWSQNSDFLFYHRLFSNQYPTFWSLFPVAALIITGKKNAIGSFSLCIFCVAIALHSFAGMKAERFIFYAMPFFFIVWGITIIEIARFLSRFARSLNKQIFRDKLTPNINFLLDSIYIVLIAVFLIINNPGLENSLKTILNRPVISASGRPLYWDLYNTNWAAASDEILKPLAAQASVLVTTQGLHSLYFLGDYDFDFSATRITDYPDNMRREFQVDPRTGRRIISSAESIRLIIECYPDGLIVAHQKGWKHPGRLNQESAKVIEKLAQPIPLPQKWNLIAYKWKNPVGSKNPKCETLMID